jgi:Rab GDP dissociation inhibitor
MEDTYDVIILGTGLTECILSGLLSVNGKKVLHMDRNEFYGGACASLTLEQIWKHFQQPGEPPEKLGTKQQQRKYSIDLLPKFLMANGKMVKLLLHTDVTRYLQFKSVDGSYVTKDQKVMKVPANEGEALGTSLMGFFEKRRFKDYLVFCTEYDPAKPKTHGKIKENTPTSLLIKEYDLDPSTQDVIGHALCLYTSADWQQEKAIDTVMRTKLYVDSLRHYGKSPYLYPIYGLGDLPQGFARLSAIYGGTYMLNKSIQGFTFDDKGRVTGVKSEGEVAKCTAVIGDPTYFNDKVKQVGQIVRCINILNHPIPNTNDSESVQIILPNAELKRKNDIYISCVSDTHEVAPKGHYIVLVSTFVETANPKAELQPGLALLGNVLHQFWSVDPVYVPTNNYKEEGIHISNSYDATSHFETIANDVIRIYREVTGEQNVDYLFVPKEKPAEK